MCKERRRLRTSPDSKSSTWGLSSLGGGPQPRRVRRLSNRLILLVARQLYVSQAQYPHGSDFQVLDVRLDERISYGMVEGHDGVVREHALFDLGVGRHAPGGVLLDGGGAQCFVNGRVAVAGMVLGRGGPEQGAQEALGIGVVGYLSEGEH